METETFKTMVYIKSVGKFYDQFLSFLSVLVRIVGNDTKTLCGQKNILLRFRRDENGELLKLISVNVAQALFF